MSEKNMDADKEDTFSALKESIVEMFGNAYNRERKELWGRTAIGWGKLILFYIFFYLNLAGFFAGLFFMWRLVILNRDSPRHSGPDDGLARTPGLSHFPILDLERKSTLIRFTRSNDTQIGEIKDLMYDSFLEGYEPKYWNSENGNFIDCSQGRTDPDPEKVCEFKLDRLVPCVVQDDYGWADGQPCIILKLNRINNWEPVNYEEHEVPDEIRDVWQKDRIALKCFGDDPVGRDSIGEINYYPYAGWSFDYFPFTGQQGYKSPLVAVQFMSLPHRALVFITCKAYAKNMIYEATYKLGMTRFEIISD